MFTTHRDAGYALAERLTEDIPEETWADLIVIPVIPSGLAIATEIVKRFHAGVKICGTQRLFDPQGEHLPIGVVTNLSQGVYLNERLIHELDLLPDKILQLQEQAKHIITAEVSAYSPRLTDVMLKQKYVLIVDDGVTTGATVKAITRGVWTQQPKKVMIAIPVCPKDVKRQLEMEADAVVVLDVPDKFFAVRQVYEDNPENKPAEIKALLSYYETLSRSR